MRDEGWELEDVKFRYHKEEQLNVGTEACYVKHCRSTRPAYYLMGEKDGKSTELMYVYQPMGLSRQYPHQGSILARFRDMNLALHFLEVAWKQLGVKYLDSACTVAMESQEGDTPQKDIRAIWQAAKADYDIEDYAISIKTEPKDLPEVCDWSSFATFLALIAQPVCLKHHTWMLDQYMLNHN